MSSASMIGSARAVGGARLRAAASARHGARGDRALRVVGGSREDLMRRAGGRLSRMEEGWKPSKGGLSGTSREVLQSRVVFKAARYGVDASYEREVICTPREAVGELAGLACSLPRFKADDIGADWTGVACKLPRFSATEEDFWGEDSCTWPRINLSCDSFDELCNA